MVASRRACQERLETPEESREAAPNAKEIEKARMNMKHRKGFLLSALVATGIAFGIAPYASGAGADSAKGAATKTKGAPGAAADPPTVANLASMLEGLKWGINHNEVINVYNKVDGLFDREYNPLLLKTQPGVQMRALEADRDNRKSAFERSFLEFKDTPTGYDATGLKTEYTYRNREAIMMVDKGGKKRYFFFIGAQPGERLWKIYDEIPLDEAGPLGKTYQEAVTKLQATLGVAARIRAADAAQGLSFTTADWQDNVTHLRAIDRAFQRVVGVALEERSTLSNIANLRSNKAEDPLAMDPSISAITRGGISDPSAAAPSASASAKPGPKKK
jgi:hypothetical protein